MPSSNRSATTRTGVENDGYLFKYKYTNPWYFDYPGSALDPYAALLSPVTHDQASTFELYDPVEQMIRAINGGTDDQFMSTVGVYIDLPLFMRYVAVQSLIAEWDGTLGHAGVNNFYLYPLRALDALAMDPVGRGQCGVSRGRLSDPSGLRTERAGAAGDERSRAAGGIHRRAYRGGCARGRHRRRWQRRLARAGGPRAPWAAGVVSDALT